MEIKDIVEQQKLKQALERSKKKQDDFTRKEFLKDCYKFWKEYKKVEHPYTWWLGWFSLWNMIDTFYLGWYRLDAPKAIKSVRNHLVFHHFQKIATLIAFISR